MQCRAPKKGKGRPAAEILFRPLVPEDDTRTTQSVPIWDVDSLTPLLRFAFPRFSTIPVHPFAHLSRPLYLFLVHFYTPTILRACAECRLPHQHMGQGQPASHNNPRHRQHTCHVDRASSSAQADDTLARFTCYLARDASTQLVAPRAGVTQSQESWATVQRGRLGGLGPGGLNTPGTLARVHKLPRTLASCLSQRVTEMPSCRGGSGAPPALIMASSLNPPPPTPAASVRSVSLEDGTGVVESELEHMDAEVIRRKFLAPCL